MLNLQLLCPCFVHLDNLAYLQHALDQKTPLLFTFWAIKKINNLPAWRRPLCFVGQKSRLKVANFAMRQYDNL